MHQWHLMTGSRWEIFASTIEFLTNLSKFSRTQIKVCLQHYVLKIRTIPCMLNIFQLCKLCVYISVFEIVIDIDWNNCLPFESPAKTLTSCKQTGADQYCSIQCEANTHPSGILNTNKYYTCGPSTQFQWSHSLQNVTLPFCSGKRPIKTLC